MSDSSNLEPPWASQSKQSTDWKYTNKTSMYLFIHFHFIQQRWKVKTPDISIFTIIIIPIIIWDSNGDLAAAHVKALKELAKQPVSIYPIFRGKRKFQLLGTR